MFSIIVESLSIHLLDQVNKYGKCFIMFIVPLFMSTSRVSSQNTGFILVRSKPSGAEVIINGKSTFKKTTFQMPMEEGTYEIELKLDMFHQYKENITVQKGQTVTKDIVLKPEFGTITINSEPADADIILDGLATNKKTPATITNVASGMHTIILIKDMYTAGKQELIVNDEQITEKFVKLLPEDGSLSIKSKPETDFGSLSIMVDPPETAIYINGKYFGLSPKVIDSLALGNYNLSLKKDGYAIETKPVLIIAGKSTSVTASLQKGKLIKITSSPDGAEIIYNDKPAGITPAEFIVKDGTNNIIIRKKYYVQKVVTIYAEKDYQAFKFSLDADTKYEKLGIHIETNPSQADIQLNKINNPEPLPSFSAENPGSYSGKSPLNIDIPIGEYNVKIEKKQYKPIERDVFIDKEQNFKFNLEPIRYRTRGNAILLSILWPGAGQSYLKRGSAHYLMGFAGYGLLTGAIIESVNFNKNYKSYLNVNSSELINKCKTELNMYYTFLISAGVVWTTNLIWTLFTPSEEKKYQKLTLNLNYNKVVGMTEMGMKINF